MELFGPIRSIIQKLRRINVIDRNGSNPLKKKRVTITWNNAQYVQGADVVNNDEPF